MTTASPVRTPRQLEHLVAGQPTSDGAGVQLTRVISSELQQRLDPFLMMDQFGSDNPDDYIAGFPDHPHRGFETITYMIAGRMRHNDSAGNEGLLENGGVQWMTAGSGVIHSELPQQEEGTMEGFQLWLNLPASDKMCKPWYQDFQAADLPQLTTAEGVKVIVIAGESHGLASTVQREATQPLYLDLHMPAGSRFEQPIPEGHHAFVYVYRGKVQVGGQAVGTQRLGILAQTPGSDGVAIETSVDSKVLLIAGKPLREPIVQYGPFVMNTQEQIFQALRDMQSGRLVQQAG